jgi:hypothetical protein
MKNARVREIILSMDSDEGMRREAAMLLLGSLISSDNDPDTLPDRIGLLKEVKEIAEDEKSKLFLSQNRLDYLRGYCHTGMKILNEEAEAYNIEV